MLGVLGGALSGLPCACEFIIGLIIPQTLVESMSQSAPALMEPMFWNKEAYKWCQHMEREIKCGREVKEP